MLKEINTYFWNAYVKYFVYFAHFVFCFLFRGNKTKEIKMLK